MSRPTLQSTSLDMILNPVMMMMDMIATTMIATIVDQILQTGNQGDIMTLTAGTEAGIHATQTHTTLNHARAANSTTCMAAHQGGDATREVTQEVIHIPIDQAPPTPWSTTYSHVIPNQLLASPTLPLKTLSVTASATSGRRTTASSTTSWTSSKNVRALSAAVAAAGEEAMAEEEEDAKVKALTETTTGNQTEAGAKAGSVARDQTG